MLFHKLLHNIVKYRNGNIVLSLPSPGEKNARERRKKLQKSEPGAFLWRWKTSTTWQQYSTEWFCCTHKLQLHCLPWRNLWSLSKTCPFHADLWLSVNYSLTMQSHDLNPFTFFSFCLPSKAADFFVFILIVAFLLWGSRLAQRETTSSF